MQAEPTPSTATITSAQRRNRSFFRRYLALCKAKNLQPVTELVNGSCGDGAKNTRLGRLKRSRRTERKLHPAVEFYGDRFKATDWQVVVEALAEDTTLEMVAIRLRKVLGELQEYNANRSETNRDHPVILTKRLFSSLINSLSEFMIVNKKVRILTLEALPIQNPHMSILINGLQQNNSITELSLARSIIRDEGCEAICSAVMHLPNIESLNLSACHVTSVGCCAVVELIKFQKIQRFAESWECSLRYREIDTDKMQGLRHILLNANPRIGDEGLRELTEALKDDEWIRQVQFRNCGLTDVGAKFIVDCLNINKTIKEFDIRGNTGISMETCHEILVKLGVEVEASDSSQSLIDKGMFATVRVKPSEQIKCLQQQLTAEKYRSLQLQRLVEQFRLQQTEFAVQMSKLRQDYEHILKEREELLYRVQRLEKPRPSTRRSKIPKSKSDNAPKMLFSRNGSMPGQHKQTTKSEMTLRWLHDRHINRPSTAFRRSQVMERTIGDCSLNTRLQGIEEANEELEIVHEVYNEGGFGDMGAVGSCRKKNYDENNEDQSQYDEADECSIGNYMYEDDQCSARKDQNSEVDYTSGSDEEDDADERSGAGLLKTMFKERSTPNLTITQSARSLFGLVDKSTERNE